MLDALDTESLAAQRRLTVPFVRELARARRTLSQAGAREPQCRDDCGECQEGESEGCAGDKSCGRVHEDLGDRERKRGCKRHGRGTQPLHGAAHACRAEARGAEQTRTPQ